MALCAMHCYLVSGMQASFLLLFEALALLQHPTGKAHSDLSEQICHCEGTIQAPSACQGTI